MPFTILRGDRRRIDATTDGVVALPAPAPPGSYLRFAGIGTALQVSLDDGATWQAAQRRPQERQEAAHFSSYLTPILPGVTSVRVRGSDNEAVSWMARDFSIFGTPRAPSGCSPRPGFRVTTAPGASGRLDVGVVAERPPHAPDNLLHWLRVGQAANGRVHVANQVLGPGGSLAAGFGTQALGFQVARLEPGAATTVPLVLVDDCGEWRTFIGGGPRAF